MQSCKTTRPPPPLGVTARGGARRPAASGGTPDDTGRTPRFCVPSMLPVAIATSRRDSEPGHTHSHVMSSLQTQSSKGTEQHGNDKACWRRRARALPDHALRGDTPRGTLTRRPALAKSATNSATFIAASLRPVPWAAAALHPGAGLAAPGGLCAPGILKY